jgi:hypothetical protein
VLPLIAILLMSCFGIAAIVVDVGVAATSRLELENAVDAALLGVAPATLFGDADLARAQAEELGMPLWLETPRDVSTAHQQAPQRGFARRIPLLFGQGAQLRFETPAGGVELIERRWRGEFTPEFDTGGLRERGMPDAAETVVGTERFGFAVRVGVAHAETPGRADVALRAECWPTRPGDTAIVAPSDADGRLAVRAVVPEAVLPAACYEPGAGITLAPAAAIQWIGDRVGVEFARAPAPTAPLAVSPAYVPLLDGQDGRILAFGRASVSDAGAGSIAITRDATTRSARNASALRVSAVRDPARDQRVESALEERAAWLAARTPDADPGWLVAPLLSRSAP